MATNSLTINIAKRYPDYAAGQLECSLESIRCHPATLMITCPLSSSPVTVIELNQIPSTFTVVTDLDKQLIHATLFSPKPSHTSSGDNYASEYANTAALRVIHNFKEEGDRTTLVVRSCSIMSIESQFETSYRSAN